MTTHLDSLIAAHAKVLDDLTAEVGDDGFGSEYYAFVTGHTERTINRLISIIEEMGERVGIYDEESPAMARAYERLLGARGALAAAGLLIEAAGQEITEFTKVDARLIKILDEGEKPDGPAGV